MALRFVDSFDHYATAQITRKWTTNDSAIISAGNGRRGTPCLRLTSSNNFSVSKGFDAQATWIVGFSVRFASFSSTNNSIIEIQDGTSAQMEVKIASDGSLRVTRNGTLMTSTAAGVIAIGVTNYLEFKTTINNSTGSYVLRVNGSNVLSASGVDTQNTTNATANVVRIGSSSPGGVWTNADIDDLYICDGSGSANNDFLGDVRVDCFFPNGNGNSSQFVGSDSNSTDNYLLVDESAVNDDTDYVQSSTTSEKDTYAFSDMSHSPPSIYGVQINMEAEKTDAGARQIQSVIRSGGSDTDGSAKSLATVYSDYLQIAETDPNTSAAWTQTGFNAAEFGVKVAA